MLVFDSPHNKTSVSDRSSSLSSTALASVVGGENTHFGRYRIFSSKAHADVMLQLQKLQEIAVDSMPLSSFLRWRWRWHWCTLAWRIVLQRLRHTILNAGTIRNEIAMIYPTQCTLIDIKITADALSEAYKASNIELCAVIIIPFTASLRLTPLIPLHHKLSPITFTVK